MLFDSANDAILDTKLLEDRQSEERPLLPPNRNVEEKELNPKLFPKHVINWFPVAATACGDNPDTIGYINEN